MGTRIYIDGDNNPGTGGNPSCSTHGIEYLTSDDKVIILYSNSCTFYRSSKNQQELRETTQAELEFQTVTVANGIKNACDFAIGMRMAFDLATLPACNCFLVSKDAHISFIAGQLNAELKRIGRKDDYSKIKCYDSILSGILAEPERIDTIETGIRLLDARMGKKVGSAFYSRMKELQKAEFVREQESLHNDVVREDGHGSIKKPSIWKRIKQIRNRKEK